MAFQHMYFAGHRSGAREILYKSGLNQIAFYLNRIPNCNVDGTTPCAIISHDIPLKLLRILNQPELVNNLFSERGIEASKAVYGEYGKCFGKGLPNGCQWNYLAEIHANTGIFAKYGFMRTLYNRLFSAQEVGTLRKYEAYFRINRMFLGHKTRIPKVADVDSEVEKLENAERFLKNNLVIDGLCAKRQHQNIYEYEGTKYSVKMPSGLFELCRESVIQGNCLLDYAEDNALGNTTILFVRKNNAMNAPFVCMEIRDWQIRQVYGRFNKLPSTEVYSFLSEYAHNKLFRYNPSELILNELLDDDLYYEVYDKHEKLIDFASAWQACLAFLSTALLLY